MSDSKTNRVPAKIAEWANERLRDRAYEIRKKTGEVVTLGALLDQAVAVFTQESASVLVTPAPPAHNKTAFDELMEVDPEAAEGLVPFIQIQIEKARKLKVARPNRVVPEEGAGARTTDRQKKRA